MTMTDTSSYLPLCLQLGAEQEESELFLLFYFKQNVFFYAPGSRQETKEIIQSDEVPNTLKSH